MDSSLSAALLDPQLAFQPNDMSAGGFEEDPFADDVKPKVENGQLRINIPHTGQDEEMEDLFGDGEEEEEGGEKDEETASPAASAPRDASEALSASELKHRRELEYEEDEGQEENVVELKHAVLSIPNIPMPRSSDGNNWVIKMPNFVKLDPKPFHPESYVGPEQSTDGVGEKEKSLSIKLEVENTIRWRWTKDEFGQDKRQSNSRIIRWSDGTQSLLLGKELFDISQAYEGVSGLPRQTSSLGSLSQSQNLSQNTALQARGSGLTYLVAQHKRPGILQTEAPVTGHMTLRPTGMQSETHRKLARAVGQKHSRVARLRIAPDSVIEQEQQELMKAAQKKPRRARTSTAGENDELGGSMRKRRSSYSRRRENVWSDEEPDAGAFGDSDEDGEGEYDASPRKSRRSSGDGPPKGAESKRGAGDYQTDDFLVADSSEGEAEEDSDAGGKRKNKSKRRRRRSAEEDAEGEVDALDELDAKIARQEEESRRKKRAAEHVEGTEGDARQAEGRGTEDAAMDMDVESEEEEEDEEFNVRRTGTGSRKKRAIAMDEEEEE
ncbi:hypothetical protein M0805_005835 [Coniferiporia weirii]|nr:hypothetical protein M0805_005835 [Coniferiporia weirii]